MSWSSEFEPGKRKPSRKGRSLSFSEEEVGGTPDFRNTQDFAHTTLQVPAEKPIIGGPSRTVVALTLGLATVALVAFVLYVQSSSGDSRDTTSTGANVDAKSAAGLTSLVESLDTTALSFKPGSVQFTSNGLATAERIRTALRKSPAETVAIEVRTYSEDGAAKNHSLSQEQATAVREFLLEDGLVAERQVVARGLGSADIHLGDQHSHFITADLPLASIAVQNSSAQDSNFAFAGPPTAWPDSGTNALQAITKVLEEEQGTNVVFNIHTFDSPTDDSTGPENQEGDPERDQNADVEEESAEAPAVEPRPLLTPLNLGFSRLGQPRQVYQQVDGNSLGQSLLASLTEQGVDSSRVSITYIENEPVQVPAGVNTVVSVQAGKPAEVARLLESTPDIRFVPGKGTLDENGKSSLDELAKSLAETSEMIFIDVHTFSQQTAEDNKDLSERQAASVTEYLAEKGIEDERLKMVGSGNSNQFDESGKLTITVLSVTQ